jgi:class 3 adenylate cyclase
MRCRSCDHDNRADRRFCAECGALLAASCGACGAANEPGEKFCGGCGARLPPVTPAPGAAPPTPEPAGALPAGERRQLTVLFSDLVGSTEIAARLDAEEWRALVVEYHRLARDVMARFAGHVAKNLGDGFLAYFGWPTAHEDDAERAARAGLAIVDAVKGLGVTPPLSVRIGIDTGPVVIGDGSEVYGDTANIAARVQSLAAPDTVLVTAVTQRLVSGLFIVDERGPQSLKGVAAPRPAGRSRSRGAQPDALRRARARAGDAA